MIPIGRMLLWFAFILACFLPASALNLTASENCIWEIFSTGYDAQTVEATGLVNRTETPTSNYDTPPIYRESAETRSTEVGRILFGQNAEFKAAEETGVSYRIGEPVEQEGGYEWASQSPQQRIDTIVEKYGFNLNARLFRKVNSTSQP